MSRSGSTNENRRRGQLVTDTYPNQRQCMEMACGNTSAHIWCVGKVRHYLFRTYDFEGELFVVIYPTAGVGEPTVVIEVYIGSSCSPVNLFVGSVDRGRNIKPLVRFYNCICAQNNYNCKSQSQEPAHRLGS